MTVSYQDILAAAPAVEAFSKARRFKNFGVAYKLAKLSKQLNERKDFYLAEERKLINDFAKKDEQGNIMFNEEKTMILFNDPVNENLAKFSEALNSLKTSEITNIPSLEINISDIIINPNEGFRPADLVALEPFITFKDDVCDEPEVIN